MQNLKKRLIIWAAVVAIILLVPLAAMQFSNEVKWGLFDFIFMGALISGIGLTYELVSKKSGIPAYRIAVGVALLTALLLVWSNAAVGIIGSENNAINLLYPGMLIAGFIGAFILRFQARAMSGILFAMAFVQMLVPVIALIVNKNDFEPGIEKVFVLNAGFALLFAVSAILFRYADTKGSKKNEELQGKHLKTPVHT